MVQPFSRSWWSEKDSDSRHDAVVNAYTHLRTHDERHDAYLEFMSLYTNRDLRQGGGVRGWLNASTSLGANKYTRVPFNLIKLIIDTVAARIAKFRPRPRYLTDEGNYTLRKKADRLQRWVDMQFYTTELYQTAPRAFVDACIYGLGAIKVSRQDNEVIAERIYPGELLVDEHEAFFDTPRQLFQTKLLTKDVVKALWPGMTDIIDQSSFMSDKNKHDPLGHDPLSEQVEVVEAWHLPSSPEAGDGRRMVFVSEGSLTDEKYVHHDFPFSFVRWMPEPRGFWGLGLAEDLLGIHLDVNTTIRKIEKSLELTASPQVWIQNGSSVDAEKITNIPGSVNFYTGDRPPTFLTPSAVPADVFAYLQQQIGRAFQIARLSESTVGGQIPSGLETGAAVRNFHDIGTESFSLPARAYEDLFLDLARKYVRTGKEIWQNDKKYSVVLEKDKFTVEKVPWKEVELDDRKDAFVIKVFPASSLSMSPSGRMADIQDLLNMQLISPEEGRALLDFEDLEASNDLATAVSENIDRILEKILDENTYEPPDPFTDLQLAMKKAQAMVQKATRMGVPEPRIAKLRMFARQASALIKRAEQEVLAQQAALQATAAPPPDGSGQPPGAVTGQEI